MSHQYCFSLVFIFILGPLICLFYLNQLINVHADSISNQITRFDLYDDDDKRFLCPTDIEFLQKNRRHLAIILTEKLLPHIWRNFRALLCSGVDAYIMLDQVFQINSSSRGDGFPSRTNRSERSYSHRFLYVTNQNLIKFGVRFMKKLPRVEFTSWDRSIVWLYHHTSFTNVWIIEHDVQWYDVRNMTYLFDRYANDSTDLLCDNIVETNTYWGQWPKVESDIFPKSKWIGTFSPLVRWSRRLLEHHYRYVQLIHKDRLKYEIDYDFRFQEFIMGTIARTENLPVAVYSLNNTFIHIVLGNMDDKEILKHLQEGKCILHPVKQESILTNYPVKDIAEMIRKGVINVTKTDFIKKEK